MPRSPALLIALALPCGGCSVLLDESGIVGGTSSGANAGSGGGMTADQVFDPCRFHFGAADSVAMQNPSMISQLAYFTPGSMGQKDTFDMDYVCAEGNPGGQLATQVPVIVADVAASYATRHDGLCDCNTNCAGDKDLCHEGAAYIQQNLAQVLAVYKSYAQGFASCYGTTRPIVFEMEPNFYQYTYADLQTVPWTFAEAGQIMSQFVGAMKSYLPNAVFSMDISPWVGTNNNTGTDGADNGKNWYSNLDMTQFTFINTSGGDTDAATSKIRSDAMTWAGVSQVTNKPILADTTGPDAAWDLPANINARIGDGVVGVAQYKPAADWGATLADIRAQLDDPKFCP